VTLAARCAGVIERLLDRLPQRAQCTRTVVLRKRRESTRLKREEQVAGEHRPILARSAW
jgi:hypothetical protein